MRKLLISLGGTLMVGSAVAGTMSHDTADFINNGTYLSISNNMTWNFGSASNAYFFSYSSGTNVYASSTNGNAATLLNPPAVVDVDVYPDMNADVNPNVAITVTAGVYTNYNLARYQSPVYIQQTNFVGAFNGLMPTNTTATNTVTFTFVPLADGENPDQSGPYQGINKSFVFTFIPTTNNAAVTITTNLPTGFLQGIRKIRLASIGVSSVSTSPGVTIDRIRLVGWKP